MHCTMALVFTSLYWKYFTRYIELPALFTDLSYCYTMADPDHSPLLSFPTDESKLLEEILVVSP